MFLNKIMLNFSEKENEKASKKSLKHFRGVNLVLNRIFWQLELKNLDAANLIKIKVRDERTLLIVGHCYFAPNEISKIRGPLKSSR